MLINYMAFVDSLFVTFSVSAMLWLRYKRPEMRRPIKVCIQCSSLVMSGNVSHSESFNSTLLFYSDV